jgi:hypothetical protein
MSLRAAAIALLALSACVERPLDDQASATAENTASTGTTSGEPPATTLPSTGATPGDPSSTTGNATDWPTSGEEHTSRSFLPHLDWGTKTECDVWTQDCPPGQKCMPYADDGGLAWNNHKCVDLVPDPAGLNEPCSVLGDGLDGEDSCDVSLMCWPPDADTGQGTCVGLCFGSPEAPSCADPMAICIINGGGVLDLCLPPCDPLAQNCPPGEACLPQNEVFLCVPDASGEAGQALDPCEYINVCDPGLVCLTPELGVECDPRAAGCCLPFCDLTLPNTCPGQGQVCIPWYEEGQAPPSHANVGVCGLAP